LAASNASAYFSAVRHTEHESLNIPSPVALAFDDSNDRKLISDELFTLQKVV
jgi:hypothetical protein